MADLVNFNLLKFKERDALEDVLRSWTSAAAGAEYDAAALRDTRLRHFFGKCSSDAAYLVLLSCGSTSAERSFYMRLRCETSSLTASATSKFQATVT
jgi:Domain of unknown function (DUF4471)